MPYLGNDLYVAQPSYRNIDDISGSFNGSTTSFPLTVSGSAPVPFPINSNQCLISVAGVVQRPDDTGSEGFRISGANIIFSSAPGTGVDFFGVILAGADYVNVGVNFPSGSAVAPSITFDSDLDTGIYNSAPNQVSITTSGTERLRVDSSGQIESVSLGSASSPAYSWTADPNTGIYSPGADQVAVATNGTGRLFVDASGNVGVGPISTSSFLSGSSTVLSLRDTATGNVASLKVLGGVGAGAIAEYGATNGIGFCGTSGAHDFTFYTNSTERLRITSAGLVGVGTSSPGSLLHAAGKIRFGSNASYYGEIDHDASSTGSNIYDHSDSGGHIFRNGGTERLRIDSSGRLLVGTSTESGNALFTIRGNTGSAAGAGVLDIGLGTTRPGAAGTPVGYLRFTSTSNTGSNYHYASIAAETDGTSSSDTDIPGRLVFSTTADGASSPTERLRITSAGFVGIGTSSPGALLDINGSGNIVRLGDGTNTFDVRFKGPNNWSTQLDTSADKFNIQRNSTSLVTVDSAGRLGIGTTSPVYSLDIVGDLRVTNSSGGTIIANRTSNPGSVVLQHSGTETGQVQAVSGGGLNFYTGSTPTLKATLDNSGRLLVGTSSASSVTFPADARLQIVGNNGGNAGRIALSRSVTAVDTAALGEITFADNVGEFARISANCDGTPGTNDYPGRLVFSTTADGASSPTEAMRIDNQRNILAGGATDANVGSGVGIKILSSARMQLGVTDSTDSSIGYSMYSTGAAAYRFYVGFGGTIYATSTTISAISDSRLKENIKDLDVGLDAILALKPRKFDWKEGFGNTGKNVRGFIAQEVEEIFPDLIDEWEKGENHPEGEEPYKSVRQDLIPVLVKAIQEQQVMIAELQTEVAALKGA